MSSPPVASANVQTSPERIGRTHPLRRAGFAAIVFSGFREALGELAGEATAHTLLKFVLDDPTLTAQNDFARSSGCTLPRWPAADVDAIDGVCFVFTSAEHPAIAAIRDSGGRCGDHYVITSGLQSESDDSKFIERLAAFVGNVGEGARIAIVGFGQQGQRIARVLIDTCGMPLNRISVWDSNPNSAALAVAMGLRVIEDDCEIDACDGVIASPLSRYERIAVMLDRARNRGIATLDNAQQASGLPVWHQQSDALLDEAANRTLCVDADLRVACRDARMREFTITHVIREEQRTFAGVTMSHLHSGQSHAFSHASAIDISQRWCGDGLAEESWGGSTRAFVSLRNRADFGFFAARQFCIERWPQATCEIMPAEHPIDLGATAFERLLTAHMDAREIVATMQTPLQRVTLGVVAAQYSSDRPIIEIGSALGGSALHLAAATSRSRPPIISIDPDAPTREVMRFAFEREGQINRLQQIIKTSDEAARDLAHLRNACGLVFIDGLHTATAVRRDFHHYSPLLAIGGALAFHDVCPALHSVMQTIVADVLPDKRFAAKCFVDGLLVLERVQ